MHIKDDRVQLVLGVVIGFGLIIGFAIAFAFAPGLIAKYKGTNVGIGIVMDPPRNINDYTLTDQNGQPFRISSLRGKYALVFFGFVNCPDVCPVTMVEFKRIKKELAGDASKIQFVMISLDGERDTPEVMKRYLEAFDAEFIGLTGHPDLIRGIGSDFGVQFEKQKLGSPGIKVDAKPSDNYTVAHTSFSYLIDSQGNWVMAFPFQSDSKAMAAEIQRRLK